MKHSLIVMAVVGLAGLAGCQSLGYQGMTADQIKATAGTSTCTQFTTLYGKSSMIALNEQDVKKGVTATGKVAITCGDASMTIETTATAPASAASGAK